MVGKMVGVCIIQRATADDSVYHVHYAMLY